MIQRRAAELGTRARIGCHTFRATGITAYLEAGGTLENAQAMAAHESPRTTKLYDRTGDEITLDEVERITNLTRHKVQLIQDIIKPIATIHGVSGDALAFRLSSDSDCQLSSHCQFRPGQRVAGRAQYALATDRALKPKVATTARPSVTQVSRRNSVQNSNSCLRVDAELAQQCVSCGKEF